MTGRGQLRWRKASRSDNTGGNCVEVAGALSGHVVRDSKNPSGPQLRANLGALLAAIQAGQFGE